MTAEGLTRQPSPPARPRRSDATRAAILRAAKERFAADGYERATIRAIATEADIDPSMVMRYYGSKENLFAQAAQFDLRLPDLSAVPRRRLGETLTRTFLDRWGKSEALPIMLRAAMTNAAAASQLQSIYRDQLAASVAAIAPGAEAQERAGMVATQVLGLAICRYVLKFPPIAEMPDDQVVARFSPTLQRYLTGPLEPPSPAEP
jgi:AcrR family transcriptional regulator